MERSVFKNIAGLGRCLKFGIGTIAGVGLALFAMPMNESGKQFPNLEATVKCEDEHPVIEVKGVMPVPDNQTAWLVASEFNSRKFRVLNRNPDDAATWVILERYPGFAVPRPEYTDLPVSPFKFSEGKTYDLQVFFGGLSKSGMPRLDKPGRGVRFIVPACSAK